MSSIVLTVRNCCVACARSTAHKDMTMHAEINRAGSQLALASSLLYTCRVSMMYCLFSEYISSTTRTMCSANTVKYSTLCSALVVEER
eukprot:19066-Heterococcus_DN1.PRE.3